MNISNWLKSSVFPKVKGAVINQGVSISNTSNTSSFNTPASSNLPTQRAWPSNQQFTQRMIYEAREYIAHLREYNQSLKKILAE